MDVPKTPIQYVGNSPLYLDDFGDDCERSCKGSLHLLPKKLIQVTDQELKHIKEKRPDVFKQLRVLPKPKMAAKPVPESSEEGAKEDKEELEETQEEKLENDGNSDSEATDDDEN